MTRPAHQTAFLSLGLLVAGCACSSSAQPAELLPAGSPIEARVSGLSSSTVTVSFRAPRDASAVTVELAPEPTFAGPVRAVGRVEPRAGRQVVRGLAAGTHVFLRVTAVGTQSPPVILHARLRGGPRVRLDGPVRSVHAVAPDVLLLVLAGADGEEWEERGGWRITRHSGAALAVRDVHRHSIPVSQPEYEVAWGGDSELSTVDVEHRIFLRLGARIGERDLLTVRGPDDLEVIVPFSDRYLETPAVQLNQVGYNPRATKRYAYVSAWMGDGGALSLQGFPARAELLRDPRRRIQPRAAVGSAAIAPRSAEDEDAGTEVREIDLASLPADEAAVYRVRIPGVGVSYPTKVSEGAAFEAFKVAARGLFHNRCGTELPASRTEWPRPACHGRVFDASSTDFLHMYAEETRRGRPRTLHGGYHDAGDFDQRPSHTAIPQILMRAFEIESARFTDRQLGIIESGNGIPDLLDEALWGVAAWAALQDRDGGVRAGVESHRHPWGVFFANDDPLPYWTYAADPQTTARAAGVFAQAARLVQPFDAARARDLRERAVRAYRWATRREASPVFLIYGASELYRLTGEARYKADFERLWAAIGREGVFGHLALEHLSLAEYVRGERAMPDYMLGYMTAEGADPALRDLTVVRLTQRCDELARRILESPHAHRNIRRIPDGIDWGGGTVMGRYLDPMVARLQLGGLDPERQQRYFDAMSLAADYVLGGNPLGMVFMTGLGTVHPEEPLHLDSLAWVKRGRPPVPGVPVFGPVRHLPRAPYYRDAASAFHPEFDDHPRMRRYADVRSFVNTNEFATWESMAPHAQHFAMLIGPGRGP